MFTLNGIDAKNLVLVGDSAGGVIVVTMMGKACDAGNPLD
nr:alpha/beta hydrolase fold domain-containing protein [Pantoea sp. Fr+CA_20]